ncbi:hypothetical protein C8F01DRAFT_1118397 [Mycena amicta]|nr:hypothetical protein C8F01DRAFT_1118397 [Mycena amicta]
MLPDDPPRPALAAFRTHVTAAPNGQPDAAALAILGIKVRDYGTNNPLPALKSVIKPPSQATNRALRREDGGFGFMYGVARTMPFDDPRPAKKPRLISDDDEDALRSSCEDFFSASQESSYSQQSQSQEYQPEESQFFSQTSGIRTPTISPNGSYRWPDGEPPPGVTEGSQQQQSPPLSPTPRRTASILVTTPPEKSHPLTPLARNFSMSSLSSLSSLSPSPSPPAADPAPVAPRTTATLSFSSPLSEPPSSTPPRQPPVQTPPPRYTLRTRKTPVSKLHKTPTSRSRPSRPSPRRQESFTLEIRS